MTIAQQSSELSTEGAFCGGGVLVILQWAKGLLGLTGLLVYGSGLA